MTKIALADNHAPDHDVHKNGQVERQEVYKQTMALLERLQALADQEPEERQAAWSEHLAALQNLMSATEPGSSPDRHLTTAQLKAFGKLLRDKRNAAGLSRVQLARRAKVSDATIKFLETAKHKLSRATLIRLINVEELKLTWSDAPGQQAPPSEERVPPPIALSPISNLNCFVSPSHEPVREVAAMGRILNGAGGHVDQAGAYLDPQSAVAYLSLCQQNPVIAGLRAKLPLAEAARRILAMSGSAAALQLLALGPGDGKLEVRLLQHLADAAHSPSLDLCLLDVSQPLLSGALKHAGEVLGERSRVWGMQCNFHDLPLYNHLFASQVPTKRSRVICMLGGTMADIDNEPRFFQHSLQSSARGDLLLLDMPVARGSTQAPEEIKKRDRDWSRGLSVAHTNWLSGPIWRHCRDITNVAFHWALDTHCAIPGSYALNAVATVQSRDREERHFSMFRFKRYSPSRVAECLSNLGWDEMAQIPYGDDEPTSLGLFCKRTH